MNEKLDQQYFDVHFDLAGSKYEPIKNIGNGAYGVVCLARHRKTGANIAIKKITNVFEHFVIGMRTYREIKILRHLVNHENIISIRDVFLGANATKDVYIVFDFMDTDLKRVLESRQTLTNDHIKYFSYQILNGLAFIHQAGIIHRDMKPSNILVSQSCTLKIADFGMARQYRNHDQTQYVVTRWYRAPEVILGYMEYSQAIDLWSMGCILAEMFGRKPIFSGATTIAQIQLIFIILGTPSKSYLSSLDSDCFRGLILSVGNRQPANFKALYPNATDEGIDLLRQLLVLEPEQRISAQAALRHPFVHEFVIELNDTGDLLMEQETGKFDSGFESEKWTLEQLQTAILEEIEHFRNRFTNKTDADELTSELNQCLTVSQRVVIVDSTPPMSNLEIDTSRLTEKKRKHRRHKHLHHQHSKRSSSTVSNDDQADSVDTNDEEMPVALP